MISLFSEKTKTYPLKFITSVIDTIADNADVNILFNYFPKQIDDAKTVLTVVKSTKKKYILIYWVVDLRAFIGVLINAI
jgi:heptosyltransferase-2